MGEDCIQALRNQNNVRPIIIQNVIQLCLKTPVCSASLSYNEHCVYFATRSFLSIVSDASNERIILLIFVITLNYCYFERLSCNANERTAQKNKRNIIYTRDFPIVSGNSTSIVIYLRMFLQ